MKKRYLAWLAALHISAHAQDKNPLDQPVRNWLFILMMSLLGGFVSWYSKVKKGELAATNLFALIGEFMVSALAGLLAFLVCDYFTLPLGITGAAAGLSGHAGAKALAIGEVWLQRTAEQRFGVKSTAPAPLDEVDKDSRPSS
jgi:hypothetical protein